MRTILIVLAVTGLAGCFAEPKKEAASKPAAEPVALPYTATYSSRFEIGDAKQVETVLKTWKSFDDGDPGKVKSSFADTLRFYLRDGSVLSGPIDSVYPKIQAYREQFSKMSTTIHAIVPVKSTDKKDNWVNLWATEVSTDRAGKVDSAGLQQSWRFDSKGKVDVVYQYSRPLTAIAVTKK